jgi:hypothetical protein
MSAPHKPADRGNTLEIPADRWHAFLADFTRANRGAHARLEVLDPNTEMGRLVPTEDRVFDGVSIDSKDGELTVWLAFGASPPKDHLTHSVHRPSAIRTLQPGEGRGAVLEVESADGSKIVLELTLPEAYALPGGESGPRGR